MQQMQQISRKQRPGEERQNAQKEDKGIRDVGTAGFHASVLPISYSFFFFPDCERRLVAERWMEND